MLIHKDYNQYINSTTLPGAAIELSPLYYTVHIYVEFGISKNKNQNLTNIQNRRSILLNLLNATNKCSKYLQFSRLSFMKLLLRLLSIFSVFRTHHSLRIRLKFKKFHLCIHFLTSLIKKIFSKCQIFSDFPNPEKKKEKNYLSGRFFFPK